MASREGHALFKELLDDYNSRHFVLPDGSLDCTTNVVRITSICLKYGLKQNNQLQTVNGFTLYPKDYFCPKSYDDGKIYLTNNTVTIHHFAGSWKSAKDNFIVLLRKYIGDRGISLLVRIKHLIA